jgi:hypothetical protein
MAEVAYGRYEDAYRAIHLALLDVKALLDALDVTDRADRLLGKVYGSEGLIVQRTGSVDLLVQLRHEGTEIDPRSIRALTSADTVSVQDLLRGLTDPPTGKQIAKIIPSYSGGNLSTLTYKDASDAVLFTLTFSWNADGSWTGVTRS